MIDEKIYQAIYDELNKYLTSGWDKLIVYLEYGKASYSFTFYIYMQTDRTYVKCYDIPGVTEKDLAESFSVIDKLISKTRNAESSNLWSNLTIVISNSGQIHIDFDYTDLSRGTYQYKKKWKARYLC